MSELVVDDVYIVLNEDRIIHQFYLNIVSDVIPINKMYVAPRNILMLINNDIEVFKEKKLVKPLKAVIEEVVILELMAKTEKEKSERKNN